MLSSVIPSKFRIKNRYEILFFYENPSLLIKLNNQKSNNQKSNNQKSNNQKSNNQKSNNQDPNNQEKISNTQRSEIESTMINIIENKNFVETLEKFSKLNNQKKTVNIKSISNIDYLNNYPNYSRLSCFKFYFHYKDDKSLNRRLNGEKEFDYKYEGQNSIFKTVLKIFPTTNFLPYLFSEYINEEHIKLLNNILSRIKFIFNNDTSNIKNLPEYKNLNNNEFKKKVETEKKNIIIAYKKKYKEYEKKSDEEITKIILKKINEMGTINKKNLIQIIKSSFSKKFLDLSNKEKEEIKNILKLKKNSNSGTIIKKSKQEYFENNIKEAFNKIREIDNNINYCLVIDIKKSKYDKLNKVDKEYSIPQNIQKGGRLSIPKYIIGMILLYIVLISGLIFLILKVMAEQAVMLSNRKFNGWHMRGHIEYFIDLVMAFISEEELSSVKFKKSTESFWTSGTQMLW